MSFFKIAWLFSWFSLILVIPQDLVKAASSIDDLFHQQKNNQQNPFCQLTSQYHNSGLKPIFSQSSSRSNDQKNDDSTLVQNYFYSHNFNWLLIFQNLFKTELYAVSIAKQSPPEVDLIVSSIKPSAISQRDHNQLTAKIEPLAYLSYHQGDPKFDPPNINSPLQDYQILVNKKQILQIEQPEVAKVISQRLDYFLSKSDLDPNKIYPILINNKAGAKIGDRILFLIDDKVAHDDVINKHLLALQWVNNLRLALNTQPLDLLSAQLEMYNLEETDQDFEGTASWYGPDFHGRLTANGEIYNQYDWTAAHPSLKLGTYIKITNLNNEKSMILRINDRGPYIPPRTLDLSLGVAWCIDSIKDGVIPYQAVVMKTIDN